MSEQTSGSYIDRPATQTYLSLLQGVISRMAGNSANCKTWSVSLVSAILVLAIDKGKPIAGLIGLLPVILFMWLDAYYLRLERAFRTRYNIFVKWLYREDTEPHPPLFDMTPAFDVAPRDEPSNTISASMRSPAIWPFYSLLLCILLLTVGATYSIKPSDDTTKSANAAMASATAAQRSGAAAESLAKDIHDLLEHQPDKNATKEAIQPKADHP